MSILSVFDFIVALYFMTQLICTIELDGWLAKCCKLVFNTIPNMDEEEGLINGAKKAVLYFFGGKIILV